MREKLYKDIPNSFKDMDLKQGVITGLFAHFGSIDKHKDIILKGAFKKTIREQGPEGTNEIAHLQDHLHNKAVAVIQKLEETNDGLYYESKIGTHDDGRNFLKMVESGIIKFHSIGYSPIKEEYSKSDGANLLREIKLYEGSSLQFIASNHNTPVLGLKSIKDFNDYLTTLEKFIRTSDASDECIQSIESLLIKLKPENSTSKDKKADQVPIELKLSFEKWKI